MATPGQNDFLAFAIGVGSDVQDQTDYAANPAVTVGYGTGTAVSAYMNKTWRQGTSMAAMLGQYISQAGYNANDNGNIAQLVANFQSALQTYFAPMLVYPGNPNGNLAGVSAASGLPPMLCWDTANNIMWICYQTGTSLTAIWVQSGRQRLTANLTLWVSSTGSDTNNGLSGSTPWQTIQHAITYIQNLDFNGFTVTVNVVTGIYAAGAAVSGNLPGSSFGSLVFATSGGPVIINGAGYCFSADAGAQFLLNGNFTLNCTNVTNAVNACVASTNGSRVGLGGTTLNFGTSQFAHILAQGAQITNQPLSSYTISGAAPCHWRSQAQGVVVIQQGATITLAGSPNFSTDFALAYDTGVIDCGGLTFSGGASGTRYSVTNNGVINTGGGGASYLPGNAGGSTANGGEYV